MTKSRPSPATTAESPSAVEGSVTSSRYGLPVGRYESAWTIEDVQRYLDIGRTQAYALVKNDDFAPRLRTGRAHRWNGLRVMAWLHGDDWRTAELKPSTTSVPTTAASRRVVPSPAVPAQPTSPAPTSTSPARPMTTGHDIRRVSPPKRLAPPINPAPRTRVIDPSDVQHQRNKDKLAGLLRRP